MKMHSVTQSVQWAVVIPSVYLIYEDFIEVIVTFLARDIKSLFHEYHHKVVFIGCQRRIELENQP